MLWQAVADLLALSGFGQRLRKGKGEARRSRIIRDSIETNRPNRDRLSNALKE